MPLNIIVWDGKLLNMSSIQKKGKDIWIMMMRDSIRVLLALKATELVEILTKATFSVSKHPLNGMIPKMIEILTFHKLTNAITLELLEKKQKEINEIFVA